MRQEPKSWRLLVDPPASGFWNMAVDDALLDAATRPSFGVPVLRFYRWNCPTASLGRSQAVEEIDADYLHSNRMKRVRRSTGGSTVLHDQEWTYSVIGRLGDGLPSGVVDVYAHLSRALLQGIRGLGVDATGTPRTPLASAGLRGQRRREEATSVASCFDVRSVHEIAVGGRKLVGSAQRRRRGAVLQHGSVPLAWNRDQLAQVMRGQSDNSRFTSLSESSPAPLDYDAVLVALREGFAQSLGVVLSPSALRGSERQRAVELYSWKHVSLTWVDDGRQGELERRWGPDWTP